MSRSMQDSSRKPYGEENWGCESMFSETTRHGISVRYYHWTTMHVAKVFTIATYRRYWKKRCWDLFKMLSFKESTCLDSLTLSDIRSSFKLFEIGNSAWSNRINPGNNCLFQVLTVMYHIQSLHSSFVIASWIHPEHILYRDQFYWLCLKQL